MIDARSKLMCTFAALAMAASGGAFAATQGSSKSSVTGADKQQQSTPPKDCKKNPTDPRCKK